MTGVTLPQAINDGVLLRLDVLWHVTDDQTISAVSQIITARPTADVSEVNHAKVAKVIVWPRPPFEVVGGV
jgi:hypothetical protein